MAHFALCQRRMRGLLHRQAVLAGDAPAAGQSAHAGSLEIFAGEHAEHARHRQRSACVNRFDGGVRVRGAHERAGERAGELDVGDETPAAGEKALIFDAPQRSADTLIVGTASLGHGG